MVNRYQENILVYLIFLLPFTFILGIAITEIFGLIIILIFLFKNNDVNFLKDKKILFLLIFSVYISVHGYLTIQDDLKYSSIFYPRYLLLSISIIFFLKIFENFNINKIKNIFFFINLILIFIFIDTLFQFFNGENFFGNKIIRNRISSVFGYEFILGSFLIKIFPIYLWLLFYLNFDLKKNSKFIIIIFCGFLLSIYLSGERTSLALLLFFLIFQVIFLKHLRKIIRYSFIILIIFIFSTTLTGIGKSDLVNRIFYKTFNQLTDQVFLKEKQDISTKDIIKKDHKKIIKNLKFFSKEHEGHYKLAYNLFLTNPLFGTGPRGFRKYCREVNYDAKIGICSTHPHNFIFQFLSEIGLVGLSFYIIGLIFIFKNITKIYKLNIRNNSSYCVLISSIGIIIHLFPFLPSGNFFNNWISLLNFYLFALYFYSYNYFYKKI